MNKNMDNTAEPISFWRFLGNHKVEIPIIQRDYAQGRQGKESLREKFLKDLKDALCRDKQLKLDFVYGSEKDERLQPLDGQQRLTTLWLLHWYIALRAEQLTKKNCEVLKRFTYETRISSREFCENLCKPENFKLFDGKGIVDFIENQTWFYSAWEQDPTIQSMLRMLGGTGTNDGIERVFDFERTKEYKDCWGKLTTEEPIVFYYLPLEDFGLSDDLYVKMNARGKPLTPFENFKADLIGYLSKRALGEDDKLAECEREEWRKLYREIPAKLDNDWTDIFWDKRSNKDKKDDEQKIDEIYFAFLNRFFWNEFFIARKEKRSDDEGPYRFHINEYESEPKYPYVLRVGKGTFSDENGKEVETGTIENHNSSYAYLEGSEKGEVEYSDLEPYKFLHKGIPITLFNNLQKVLDNYSKHKDRYKKILGNSDSSILSRRIEDFKFIPEYKDETSITKVDNKAQRVIFFALCKYFYEYKEEENKEEENMLRWLRLVCKLTGKNEGGNAIVDSNLDARGAIRYLALLDSQNVLGSLFAQSTVKKADSALKRQWNEEVIKAKQISEDGETLRKYNGTLLKGKDGSKYKTWEEVIMEAEEYAFFDGTIRFLYQDGEGKEDWGYFDTKWKKAQEYFLKEPETYQNKEIWVKNNTANLLKTLIGLFVAEDKTKHEKLVGEVLRGYGKKIFNNRATSWRYYLLNTDICGPVHNLLGGSKKPETQCQFLECSGSNIYSRILHLLSGTGLLDLVIKEIPDAVIRTKDNDHYAIYQNYCDGVFLDAKERDALLQNMEIFNYNKRINNCELLYGIDINFKYHKTPFMWYRDDFIYLQREFGSLASEIKSLNKSRKTDKFYCFNTRYKNEEGNMKCLDNDQLLKKLDELKDAYEEDKKKKGKS